MPNLTFGVKRAGLRVAFLRGLLGVALLLPTALWGSGHTIKVRPPNGVDDTVNIQAALDMAVASGPGCTVQLAEGKYLIQQLVAYNFRGTFKGSGKGETTLEALPNLVVNIPNPDVDGEVPPNTTTARWPSLIVFVDGNIRVADLSIKVTAPHGTATTTWYLMDGVPFNCLIEALRFMGTAPTTALVEDVEIEGLEDDGPNSVGFNVMCGVDFVGEHPRSSVPFDYYFLGGNFTVRRSTFRSLVAGVYTGGFMRHAKVTIGGSPRNGNTCVGVFEGFDLESAEDSIFDVSHNRAEGSWFPMCVYAWCCWTPTRPSHFSIHDNTFITTAPFASGVYLGDDAANPWIRATIYHNTIESRQDPMLDGIGAYNTRGTVLWNNTITGTGAAAIQLGGDEGTDSHCSVIGNHLRGFFADPSFGLANQIHLGPATNHNLVVCASPLDTVLDQGTDNKIIGGWPRVSASAEALTMKAAPAAFLGGPHPLKRKPGRR